MSESRYLVSTRVLLAGIPQPFPPGKSFCLVKAVLPEYLNITLGEQSFPQPWGYGISIECEEATKIYLSSDIPQEITVLIGQDIVVSDGLAVALRSDGVRGPLRILDSNAQATQNIGIGFGAYPENRFFRDPLSIAAGQTVSFYNGGAQCIAGKNYYFSIDMILYATAIGYARIDFKVGGTVELSFFCVPETVGSNFKLNNVEFFSIGTGNFTIDIVSISTFAGNFAGTLAVPRLF